MYPVNGARIWNRYNYEIKSKRMDRDWKEINRLMNELIIVSVNNYRYMYTNTPLFFLLEVSSREVHVYFCALIAYATCSSLTLLWCYKSGLFWLASQYWTRVSRCPHSLKEWVDVDETNKLLAHVLFNIQVSSQYIGKISL